MIILHKKLYKRDVNGKIRAWSIQREDNKIRTVAGMIDGQQVTSKWTIIQGKNIGKINETTALGQTQKEVDALYNKKLSSGYYKNAADIDGPSIFKPMLATSWETRKSKIKYPVWIQPKLDGIRCIARPTGLFSRTDKLFVTVPHILTTLKPIFEHYPNLILDGELYNHQLNDDFNKITSLVNKSKPTTDDLQQCESMIQYHIYDIVDNHIIYKDRINLLQTILRHCDPSVIKQVTTNKCDNQHQLDHQFDTFVKNGYEGGIIRLNATYENKRSNNLIKRKNFQDKEFTIVDIVQGKGNWSGVAKTVMFKNDINDKIIGAGLKGSLQYAREILLNANKYINGVVTIQFFTRTPDGVPRFPIAKHLKTRGQ